MILVTGASGLLGANLVMEARSRSKKVLALFNRNRVYFPDVKSVQMDLLDTNKIKDLLLRYHPSCIIHCAALTNVDWCEQHPSETLQFHKNVTRNIAQIADEIGSSMIYISTDSVFDGRRGNYSEKDRPNPQNVYAKTKLDGEFAVQKELERHLIIRTNIYGWNLQEKKSIGEWMLDQFERNNPFLGFSDVICSPILVNDLSNIILDLIEKETRGLLHVGSNSPCSKYEFGKILAEVFSLNKDLIQPASIDSMHFIAQRPKNTGLTVSKVQEILMTNIPDVRSGLAKFKKYRDTGYNTTLKKFQGV
jgi:dTDP-4-dehydrorhamnose reductase